MRDEAELRFWITPIAQEADIHGNTDVTSFEVIYGTREYNKTTLNDR
jgi:hypothetical protein